MINLVLRYSLYLLFGYGQILIFYSLSRPSLSQQFSLPAQTSTVAIDPKAASSVAAEGVDSDFLLSPAVCLSHPMTEVLFKADSLPS